MGKNIFHFDIHDVYSWGACCLANIHTAVPRRWEEVVGHKDVHTMHRIWYADGGERSIRATTNPRVYELKSRPASRCGFPLTEDEELTRSEDQGPWVWLVPVGRRVSWYNQRVLTANQ